MKLPHSATNQGRKVRIRTKDGDNFIAQFVETHDRYVLVKRDGKNVKVTKKNLRSFSIHKGGPEV